MSRHLCLVLAICFLTLTSACSSRSKKRTGPETQPETQQSATGTSTEATQEGASGAPYGSQPSDAPTIRVGGTNPSDSLDWSYAGTTGPAFWGRVNPSYYLCDQGLRQSPIDLRWKKPAAAKKVQIDYQPSLWSIKKTARGLELHIPNGNTLTLNGEKFDLAEVHFHHPSQHTLSGRGFPLEAELIHRNDKGHTAIIGVFFEEGAANTALMQILNRLPTETGLKTAISDVVFQPSWLLPDKRSFYEYQGSLTEPPCYEGVSWMVFNTPLIVAPEQLQTLRSLAPENSRPAQPLHDRTVQNFP